MFGMAIYKKDRYPKQLFLENFTFSMHCYQVRATIRARVHTSPMTYHWLDYSYSSGFSTQQAQTCESRRFIRPDIDTRAASKTQGNLLWRMNDFQGPQDINSDRIILLCEVCKCRLPRVQQITSHVK